MAADASPSGDQQGADEGLSPEELEEEVALDLPDREALSLAFPLAVASTPTMASKGAAAIAEAAQEAPVEPTG